MSAVPPAALNPAQFHAAEPPIPGETTALQQPLVALLERQERTQRAVAACSQRLMGNTTNALDEQRALAEALELLREGVQVLGVDLWENHMHPEQGFSTRRTVHAWGSDDPTPQPIGGEQWSVPWSILTPSGMRAMAAGEYVGGPVERIYGDAPQSLELARIMGVGSVQAFPIRLDGQWWGLLGFNAREAREWDEQEVLQIRTAAEVVGAFLQRNRDAAALRERETMLRQANLVLNQRVDELSLLNQIAHLLGGVTELPETFTLVCRLLHETFEATEVLVALRERPASALRVVARYPDDEAYERVGTWYPAPAGFEPVGTILVEHGPDPTDVTLLVALRAQSEVIGVLHLRVEQTQRKLTPDTVSLVQTIAGAIASAAATAQLYAGAVRSSQRLERLNAASRMINGAGLDLPTLYRTIYHAVAHLMPVEAFVIALVEEGGERVEYAYCYDSRAESGHMGSAPLAGTFAGYMRRYGPTIRIDDFQAFYVEHPEVQFQRYGDEDDTRSGLAASFVTADGIYGLLFAQCYPPGAYSDDDLNILELLAAHAATAIENARRAQQARREAVDEERNRLARDLHDSVSQSLFSASLIAERLPAMARINTDEAWAGLELLHQLVRGALVEMRAMLIELRPAALAVNPLHQAIAQLAQAFAGRRGSPIATTLDVVPKLPQHVQVALYRIVQEGLSNAIKHAQAATITVRMEVQPPVVDGEADWSGSITLLISDDGRGFTPDMVGVDRLGLGIMHERAQAIGAHLHIRSAPNQGSHVALIWRGSAAREEQ